MSSQIATTTEGYSILEDEAVIPNSSAMKRHLSTPTRTEAVDEEVETPVAPRKMQKQNKSRVLSTENVGSARRQLEMSVCQSANLATAGFHTESLDFSNQQSLRKEDFPELTLYNITEYSPPYLSEKTGSKSVYMYHNATIYGQAYPLEQAKKVAATEKAGDFFFDMVAEVASKDEKSVFSIVEVKVGKTVYEFILQINGNTGENNFISYVNYYADKFSYTLIPDTFSATVPTPILKLIQSKKITKHTNLRYYVKAFEDRFKAHNKIVSSVALNYQFYKDIDVNRIVNAEGSDIFEDDSLTELNEDCKHKMMLHINSSYNNEVKRNKQAANLYNHNLAK